MQGELGVSDFCVSFSATWSVPSPIYQIFTHTRVVVVVLFGVFLFFSLRLLQIEMAWKAEVYGRSSLTYICSSLFLDL